MLEYKLTLWLLNEWGADEILSKAECYMETSIQTSFFMSIFKHNLKGHFRVWLEHNGELISAEERTHQSGITGR